MFQSLHWFHPNSVANVVANAVATRCRRRHRLTIDKSLIAASAINLSGPTTFAWMTNNQITLSRKGFEHEECIIHWRSGRFLFYNVVLSVIVLSVIMLNLINTNDKMLSLIKVSIIIMSVILINVINVSSIIFNLILVSVMWASLHLLSFWLVLLM